MRDLRVVDIVDTTVVAVDENGDEFRIALDDALIARLRVARSEASSTKVSPREIQALIRAGLSAQDVVRVSGATLDDVERYEGPVLAERDYVLTSALATQIVSEDGTLGGAFGTHVRSRLESLGAHEQRWVAWKDASEGWIVKVEFSSKNIDHDARWSFDARRSSLVPLNADAGTLTQRGDVDSGMVPRLRAVDVMTGAIPTVNDSGPHTRRIPTSPVFSEVSESIRTGAMNIIPSGKAAEPVVREAPVSASDALSSDQVAEPTVIPATDLPSDDKESTPTADLLDALRKRRMQRDENPAWLTDARVQPSTIPEAPVASPISEDVLNAVAIEITETTFTEAIATSSAGADTGIIDGEPLTETGKQRRARKTRPTLPAWDNIV
jgi:hypothetical protein